MTHSLLRHGLALAVCGGILVAHTCPPGTTAGTILSDVTLTPH